MNVKSYFDKGKCDVGFIWNHSTSECECDRSCDGGEYLDYGNCKCRKRLIGRLVLECEDGILNTTKGSFDDKKVTSKINNCFVHAISLVTDCILSLFSISISCCYFYARHWTKKNV